MSYTGHEDNKITFAQGAELTANYRKEIPSGDILAYYYSKDSINCLLNQPGCVGIRTYFARTDEGVLCLVIVGVDSEGNDQIGSQYYCVDDGFGCPANCSTPNILNS
jgi:hypothetical protein